MPIEKQRNSFNASFLENFHLIFNIGHELNWKCWTLPKIWKIYANRPLTTWKHYRVIDKDNIVFGSIGNGASVLYGKKAMLMPSNSLITIERGT